MKTYKCCKFVSWPSCGTSSPERFAFPRSLGKHVNKYQNTGRKCRKLKDKNQMSNSHFGHTTFIVAANMWPCAGIAFCRIPFPVLKNIVRIIQVGLQCIQSITCLRWYQNSRILTFKVEILRKTKTEGLLGYYLKKKKKFCFYVFIKQKILLKNCFYNYF